MIKELYKRLITKLPYVKETKQELTYVRSKLAFPPGHYYSPIFIGKQNDDRPGFFHGIDLKTQEQLNLLEIFSELISEFPFQGAPTKNCRFSMDNEFYTGVDAYTLFCFLRHFRPKQVLEVGSGFSSALMLDTKERFELDVSFKFIEPFPERLLSLISQQDETQLIKKTIQTVPLDYFSELKENDFLFIDTSHVSKTDSDVNYLLFKVLPVLKKGVMIHFHDVFYPFEYPRVWTDEEFRSWNEIYILRAFLMDNPKYEIVFFNHMMAAQFTNEYPKFFNAPNPKNVPVGSLWFRKIGE